MKKLFMVTVSLAGLLSASCAHHDDQDDKRHLLELERQWLEYEFIADTISISSLLDETFLCISPETTFTKKSIVKHIVTNNTYRKEHGIVIDSIKIENPVVRFYDHTAIVIFTDHTYAHIAQKPVDTHTQFYDVWVNREGIWKAVSSQAHY